MPVLSGAIDRWGPMIDVKAMLSPQRVEALKRAGLPFAAPVPVRGLIDTGASCSAIDIGLARELGLEQRGFIPVHTPSTGDDYSYRKQYDVCFVIGAGKEKALYKTLSVIECEFASQGFHVLVGRDLLSLCVFTYNGREGRYDLEF